MVHACRFVRDMLEHVLPTVEENTLLGPSPLAVVRVNNRYRYRVHVRCRNTREVRYAISQTLIAASTDKRFKGVSFFADVDPFD